MQNPMELQDIFFPLYNNNNSDLYNSQNLDIYFQSSHLLAIFLAGIKKCKCTSGGEQVGIKTLTNLKPNSFSALELQSSVIHCVKGILSAYT